MRKQKIIYYLGNEGYGEKNLGFSPVMNKE